jgi:hypothetical protein
MSKLVTCRRCAKLITEMHRYKVTARGVEHIDCLHPGEPAIAQKEVAQQFKHGAPPGEVSRMSQFYPPPHGRDK